MTTNTEHPEFEAYLATVKYDRGLSELNGSQSKWCDQIIVALIRLTYSLDAELAIERQRESKPEDFEAFNAYAEDAKARAKVFVYGVQQQSVTG